jgi:hypothetical protein
MPLLALTDKLGGVIRDQLYNRPLYICWSLSESSNQEATLPEQSARTHRIVVEEEILWHGRHIEPRWKQFTP